MRDKLLKIGIKTYKWAAWHHTLMPRSILVETTKACNLKCPGCRRNYSEGSIATEPGPSHLTTGALWRVIATTPVNLLRFEGDGEPICNPHFKDLVAFCHNLGIRSTMTSNGTLLYRELVNFLEKNGMGRIHVSFDGATKDTYEKTKLGGDFEETLYNCRLVGNSKIQLFMNVVLFSDTVVEELPKYVEQAKQVGATGIHYMKAQVDNLNFGNPPNLKEHKDTIRYFNELTSKAGLQVVGTCSDEPRFTPCYDPFINPFILLNNDVYACTYMANLRRSEVYQGQVIPIPYQNYKMGNLEDNWMKDIWKNSLYKELRKELRTWSRPKGWVIKPEILLKCKLGQLDYPRRFMFCSNCLCQWGESGL